MTQYSPKKSPRSGGDREGFSLSSSVEAMPRMLQSPGSFGSVPRYQTKRQAGRTSKKLPSQTKASLENGPGVSWDLRFGRRVKLRWAVFPTRLSSGLRV